MRRTRRKNVHLIQIAPDPEPAESAWVPLATARIQRLAYGARN